MRPQLKPSILLAPCIDGYLAYDFQTERLHRLNRAGGIDCRAGRRP